MPLFGGPPNIEKLKAKRDVNGLARVLSYQKDATVRVAAAKALAEIKDVAAVQPLIAALADADKEVRKAATEALGTIGDVSAIEPLIKVLNDGHLDVRRGAVDVLGKFGSAAVEPLIAALKASHEGERCSAAYMLGEIGDMRAVKPLIALFKDKAENVRHASVTALGKVGAVAVEPLIAALKDCNENVRRVAIDALGKIGVAAVEPLIAVLQDEDRNFRHDVTAALDKIGWKPGTDEIAERYWVAKQGGRQGAEKSDPAVGPLIAAPTMEPDETGDTRTFERHIAALKDEDRKVRKAAAEALGQIGDARAVEPLIVVLTDKAPYVPKAGTAYMSSSETTFRSRQDSARIAAAEALGQIGDTRAIEPLIALLHEFNVNHTAAAALARIGVPTVEPLIAAFRDKDRDEHFREGVIDALARIGVSAVEPLIIALKDADKDVRRGAADTLDKIAWKPGAEEIAAWYWIAKQEWQQCIQIGGSAIEPLIATLKDADKDVRRGAADTLDKIAWKPGTEEIAAWHWIAKEEWQQCIQIGGPAVEPLIATLENATLKDWLVRRNTAEALGKIGAVRAVDPLIAALTGDPGGRLNSTVLSERVIEFAYAPNCAAAEALGKIGDMHAIEPLIAVLRHKAQIIRDAAIAALDMIGWKPDTDEIAAWYWAAKQDWQHCVQLGSPAVEPLIAALDVWDENVRRGAADALGKIGDAHVVEPLTRALKDEHWQKRKAAAQALVTLYQFGSLNESSKAQLLQQRKTIISSHEDVEHTHFDSSTGGCMNDHTDRWGHLDQGGIGIDFPL